MNFLLEKTKMSNYTEDKIKFRKEFYMEFDAEYFWEPIHQMVATQLKFVYIYPMTFKQHLSQQLSLITGVILWYESNLKNCGLYSYIKK